MRIPVIRGVIRRRLLVNFRADPEVVQDLLPRPFAPKLHQGRAIAGICLIRLEQVRPRGFPSFVGMTSENAAHRIAVEWEGPLGRQEGVYIPRRDTGSCLNRLAGGRLFPGEHHPAEFKVFDNHREIHFRMRSLDGSGSVEVRGRSAEKLPEKSVFRSVEEASAFFEPGSRGYSPRLRRGGLDALVLKTFEWKVKPLEVEQVHSSWFSDHHRFPASSIQFDHALIMRDIPHEWHAGEELSLSQGGGNPVCAS